VLCNNYSDEIELDEIELEEHDYSLLQSVIENLQSYLFKARKVFVKGVSDKAGGLKACYSQNAVSKSVTRNYNGSYTADNGKGIIISNIVDSSRLLGELRKKCVTGYQVTFSTHCSKTAFLFMNMQSFLIYCLSVSGNYKICGESSVWQLLE